MLIKSNIRFVLRRFLTLIGTGIAVGLVVYALSARHLNVNNVFKWLGPQWVYADDNDGGDSGGDHDGGDSGGDHDGGDSGGDHDGGDRSGDHDGGGDSGDHDDGDDSDNERDTDTDDRGEGNDPADRSGEPNGGNDLDQVRNGLSGLEGIRDLTPVSKEEEAGLVGNWGSPAQNNPPGSKP